MSHGGKRTGAGRPRALTDLDRLTVGSICERLYRVAQKSSGASQISQATKAVRLEHEKARSIPIERRPEWIRSLEYEDHKDDIQFALQTDQELSDDQPPSSIMKIRVKRPWGVKKGIKENVAQEMGISERLVQTCWDEYRKLMNALS